MSATIKCVNCKESVVAKEGRRRIFCHGCGNKVFDLDEQSSLVNCSKCGEEVELKEGRRRAFCDNCGTKAIDLDEIATTPASPAKNKDAPPKDNPESAAERRTRIKKLIKNGAGIAELMENGATFADISMSGFEAHELMHTKKDIKAFEKLTRSFNLDDFGFGDLGLDDDDFGDLGLDDDDFEDLGLDDDDDEVYFGKYSGSSSSAQQGKKRGNQKECELEAEFEPMCKDGNSVKLSDVAGLEDVKETIRGMILAPLKNPEIFKRYGSEAGGAVLMYGPPGTGKTMIAKAVATEVNANFFYISSDKIVDKYVGNTEKKIAALFSKVRKNLPAVLFFDEFDNIASQRNSENKITTMTVNALITQIDGMKKDTTGMLILGATNVPWSIDSAMLSRFKNLYLPLPCAEGRAKIFEIHLKKNLPKKGLNFEYLADETEGFSGRDISNICKELRRKLAIRELETGQTQYCDMETIIKKINLAKRRPRPDVSKFEAYNEDHSESML
ncbi:MAG: AAA family ATPase [Firmicutes bacterium]|nr:AAA family ATPase [Bacillota bacterium]